MSANFISSRAATRLEYYPAMSAARLKKDRSNQKSAAWTKAG